MLQEAGSAPLAPCSSRTYGKLEHFYEFNQNGHVKFEEANNILAIFAEKLMGNPCKNSRLWQSASDFFSNRGEVSWLKNYSI